MSLRIFLEAFGQQTNIMLIRDVISTLSSTLRVAGQRAKEMAESGTSVKGIRIQYALSLARWFNSTWFKEFEPALRNLSIPATRAILSAVTVQADREVRIREEQTATANTLRIIQQIDSLKGLDPALDASINILHRAAKTSSEMFAAAIKLAGDDDNETEEEISKRKNREANREYKHTLGSQRDQADKLVAQIISGLDQRIRDDVRRAVARSDNKLQDLMLELQRRGIKV